MKKSIARSSFAKRLIEIRKMRNMTGPQIAQKVGIEYGRYHHYEIKTNPPVDTLTKIIAALEVSFDYFFAPFIKANDKDLLTIVENAKRVYRLPGGKENLPIELYKLEVYLKERLKEKFGQSFVDYLEV